MDFTRKVYHVTAKIIKAKVEDGKLVVEETILVSDYYRTNPSQESVIKDYRKRSNTEKENLLLAEFHVEPEIRGMDFNKFIENSVTTTRYPSQTN